VVALTVTMVRQVHADTTTLTTPAVSSTLPALLLAQSTSRPATLRLLLRLCAITVTMVRQVHADTTTLTTPVVSSTSPVLLSAQST
jgi:hypothetical protein